MAWLTVRRGVVIVALLAAFVSGVTVGRSQNQASQALHERSLRAAWGLRLADAMDQLKADEYKKQMDAQKRVR